MDTNKWKTLSEKIISGDITKDSVYKLDLFISKTNFSEIAEDQYKATIQLVETIGIFLEECIHKDLEHDDFDTFIAVAKTSLRILYSMKNSVYFSIIAGNILPKISEYIKCEIFIATSEKTIRWNDNFASILSEFKSFTKYLFKYVTNASTFLEICVSGIFSGIGHELTEKEIIQILSSCFDNSDTHFLLKEAILNNIVRFKGKSHYLKVNNMKISAPVLLIISLTQRGLAYSEDKKNSFEIAFSFAANLVHSITNMCEGTDNASGALIFLENLINELLFLLTSAFWPGARLLFHLIAKKISLYILKSKSAKMQKFAVKQMPKIAIKSKELDSACDLLEVHLQEKGFENPSVIIRSAFCNFCAENSSSEFFVDLKRMYKLLWCYMNRDHEVTSYHNDVICGSSFKLSRIDAATAAHYLDTNKKINFLTCVKYTLSAVVSEKKEVKTSALKSLSELIIAEPKLLVVSKVNDVVTDCLNSATIQGKIYLVSAMGSFLTNNPQDLSKYCEQFLKLLDEPTDKLRLSVINTVSRIAIKSSKEILMKNAELLSKILNLADDDNGAIQTAVVALFKDVWISNTTNVSSLISISRNPRIVKLVGRIFSTILSEQKAVCLSQFRPNLSLSHPQRLIYEENIQDNVTCLINSLVEHLALDNSKVEGIVLSLLKKIVKVQPNTLLPYTKLLVKQLSTVNEKVKKLTADVLKILLPYCASDCILEINKIMNQELISKESSHWQVTTVISYLNTIKLLLSEEEIMAKYIKPNLNILNDATSTDNGKDCKEIKKALCIVSYLCKEVQTRKILRGFVRNPKYNLTLLNVACQLRLKVVPITEEVFLEKEVAKLLEHHIDEQLTVAALYFIYCTLRGYKKNMEQPSLKDLGQTTTELVSNLLQKNLSSILACSVHSSESIRKGACGVICQTVESGLILIPKLIPFIYAMTTDINCGVANMGAILLKRAMENWDIASSVGKGLELSFSLANKYSSFVRGFNKENNVATFSLAYCTFQETLIKRRKFIENLVQDLCATKNPLKALFISDQLVKLPYKFYDEALYVIYEADKYLSLKDKTDDFVYYLLRQAKQYLMQSYNISYEKIANYSPSRKTQELLKQPNISKDYIGKQVLKDLQEKRNPLIQEELEESDEESDDDSMPLAKLAKKLQSKGTKRKFKQSYEESIQKENDQQNIMDNNQSAEKDEDNTNNVSYVQKTVNKNSTKKSKSKIKKVRRETPITERIQNKSKIGRIDQTCDGTDSTTTEYKLASSEDTPVNKNASNKYASKIQTMTEKASVSEAKHQAEHLKNISKIRGIKKKIVDNRDHFLQKKDSKLVKKKLLVLLKRQNM